MRLSTRLGLTLSGVLLLAFALFGLGEWAALRSALLGQVDRTLDLRARTLAQELARSGPRDRALERARARGLDEAPLLATSAPDVFVEVVDGKGGVLLSSANLRGQRLPGALQLAPGRAGTVQPRGESPLRMLRVPLDGEGWEGVSVVVAESLRNPHEWLGAAAARTALLAMATLLLAVAATLGVLRRGLRPLQQVAATAQAIVRTGDVSRRVEAPGTPDVVGQVAEAVNALLERVERLLETEKRLLADTSHELRNPLTVVRMDLDMLKRDLEPSTRAEVAEEAEAEVARLIRLVDELLLMARTESVGVEAEPLRLDRLVRETAERMAGLAEGKGLSLTVEDLPEAMVEGEADRLRQVFVNLLGNAVAYTPRGGTVKVRLRPLGPLFRVEVEDDGPGIAEEHLPRLFDRFYRLDSARSRTLGGTGLGLPLARALVEAHRGRIGLRSRVGEGSCFWVELPAAPRGDPAEA